MKDIVPMGILLVFLGMILIFIGALSQAKDGKPDSKIAVGGFIGFIPFGFANDKKMMYLVIGLTSIILFAWILRYLWR